MSEQKLVIPIDKIKQDFQQFIEPEHNSRIIFSGPFGIGKTYFLKKFFEEKEEEYFSIFLRPINYSLLSNEDVFKFIKYDILAQLINLKKIDINEDFEVTTSVGLKSFLKNNKLLVLKNLLKVIPKLGGLADGISQIEELYLTYRESKEKLSKELSAEQVKIFNEDFEGHFLSEFDNVSEIIKETIEKEKDLKKVLIIDDLDRLDPEHIFRLFNVFSAHFDQINYYNNGEDEEENKNDNKFGFDKIIFVCDIENIRKIFAHKYGGEVDFSGYIDKFYSTEIYRFFHNVRFSEDIYPYFEELLRGSFKNEYNSMFFNSTKLVFQILFENYQFSIRDMQRLARVNRKIFNIGEIIVPFKSCGAEKDSFISTYGFLISLRLFINIFGSRDVLQYKLRRALANNKLDKERGYYYGEVETIIPQLLLFSEIEVHKFRAEQEFEYISGNDNPISYQLKAKLASQMIMESPNRYWIPGAGLKEYLVGDFTRLFSKAVENIFKYGLIT